MNHADKGYSIRSRRFGGSHQPHAVATCVDCGLELEFPIIGRTPAEHVAKHIRSKHWAFELYRRSGTCCPKCIAKRKERRAGDSANTVVEMLNEEVVLPASLAPATPRPKEEPVKTVTVVIETTRTIEDITRRVRALGTMKKMEVTSRKTGTGRYARSEATLAKLRANLAAGRRAKAQKAIQPTA